MTTISSPTTGRSGSTGSNNNNNIPHIDADDALVPIEYKIDEIDALNSSLNSFAACFCCNPLEEILPSELVSVQGQAFDGILVSGHAGKLAASDIIIQFDHPSFPFPPHDHPKLVDSATAANSDSSSRRSNMNNSNEMGHEDVCQALMEIEDAKLGKVYFSVQHDPMAKKNRLVGRPSPKACSMSRTLSDSSHSNKTSTADTENDEQETLKTLATLLKPGRNSVRYLFVTSQRVLGVAHASMYLWNYQDRIIVCDVDGTITKTNVRGIYDTIVTQKYAYCHEQVCHFMSRLIHRGMTSPANVAQEDAVSNTKNNYTPYNHPQKQKQEKNGKVHVLYLTSRPIFIASATRKFLQSLTQEQPPATNNSNDNILEFTTQLLHQDGTHHRLPEGPLMGFGGRFMDVMKMELVSFTVHLFKASLLMDQIVTPFCNVSENPSDTHASLFVAGFGNTLMDVQAYHMAGMELHQIYLIDKKSTIACLDAKVVEEQQPKSFSKREALANVLSSKRLSSFLSRTNSSASTVSTGSDGGTPPSLKSSSPPQGSIPSDKLSGSNKFLFVDDAQPTAIADNRPCMKNPMSRSEYKLKMGTTFVGYHDERLIGHVLG